MTCGLAMTAPVVWKPGWIHLPGKGVERRTLTHLPVETNFRCYMFCLCPAATDQARESSAPVEPHHTSLKCSAGITEPALAWEKKRVKSKGLMSYWTKQPSGFFHYLLKPQHTGLSEEMFLKVDISHPSHKISCLRWSQRESSHAKNIPVHVLN